MTELLWGIDLGGTKIEGVVLAGSATRARRRIPTEAERGYEHIIKRISELVELLAAETGSRPTRAGFSTPGVLDPLTQRMKNCNTTALNGRPLASDLQKALGVPVVLANDANCFALAEAKLGVARAARSCFGIIMGTGVGGGLVYNGAVIEGHQGIAGEWGHNPLIDDGPQCYCGRRGCVETVLSGPALEQFYAERAAKSLTLAEIYAAYKIGGDQFAAETIHRLVKQFGRALAVVINIFDPEMVVLGGGVSNLDILTSEGRDAVARNVFNDRLETRIVKHSLGDSAGVFGAAMLVAPTSAGAMN